MQVSTLQDESRTFYTVWDVVKHRGEKKLWNEIQGLSVCIKGKYTNGSA